MSLRYNPINRRFDIVVDDAYGIVVDTTNFDGALSSSEDTVQKALEVLDDAITAAGVTTWGDITGTLSNQIDLQLALDGKSNVGHTHLEVDITDLDKYTVAQIDGFFEGEDSGKKQVDWLRVINKPATFPPSAHNHVAADVTDFDVEVGNHPDVSLNTAARHTQNTDTHLDLGQPNQVTSAELRVHLDDITTNPHAVDLQNLGGGTLADLNLLVTDATLDDANDPRTPTGPAGGELSGTYPNPTVNDGADATAIHDNIAGEINAVALKAIPDLGDFVIIEDSADSFNKKKVSLDTIRGLVLNKSIFFLPNTNASGAKGDYTAAVIGANASINLTFPVPADFVSLISLHVHYIPNNTIGVGETVDLNSDYALPGQNMSFNSESALGVSITGTIDTLEELDISGVFTSLLANQICGLTWKNNAIGTGINILGIEMNYE